LFLTGLILLVVTMMMRGVTFVLFLILSEFSCLSLKFLLHFTHLQIELLICMLFKLFFHLLFPHCHLGLCVSLLSMLFVLLLDLLLLVLYSLQILFDKLWNLTLVTWVEAISRFVMVLWWMFLFMFFLVSLRFLLVRVGLIVW
jgi:hypothetical protein